MIDITRFKGKPLAAILTDPQVKWTKNSYGNLAGSVCHICLSGALMLRHGIEPWSNDTDDASRQSHQYAREKDDLDIECDDLFESRLAEEFNDGDTTTFVEVLQVAASFDTDHTHK